METIKALLHYNYASFRSSKALTLAVIFMALLLDNVLLTVIVPIIPDLLATLDMNITYHLSDSRNMTSFWWQHAHNSSWSLYDYYNNASNDLDPSNIKSLEKDEDTRVGWLLATKAFVQLATNFVIGPATVRYGHDLPMFAGCCVLFLSSLMYSVGESYSVYLAARALHGVASSCIGISGMTMLAYTYTDDFQRSRAMGIAMGGLALGVLIGYPMGGLMYDFVGRTAPFFLVCLFSLFLAAVQLWRFDLSKKVTKAALFIGTPMTELLRDPCILLASGAIMLPEMAMAMLEPTLPLWLMDTMNPPRWQLGTVFIPDSLGYWLGCNFFPVLALRWGRWICTMTAMVVQGVCLFCIPFATHITHLIVPHFGVGLSLGMVDAAMMPLLAYLVDTRHMPVYGSVYAIAQVSICLGFAVGPSVGGLVAQRFGFPWLIRAIALLNILYSPLCWFLRDSKLAEEERAIVNNDEMTMSIDNWPQREDKREPPNYQPITD